MGGLQPGGRGDRRDGALAQDARRRATRKISAPRISARSSAGCRTSRSTSRTCGTSACRASSRSIGARRTPTPSCRWSPTSRRELGVPRRADRSVGEGRRRRRGARRASCSRCSTRRARSSVRSIRPNLPIKEKIDIIVRQIYGGDGADYTPDSGSRDRVPRVDRARQHADLHGEDAVLAHRRRDEARPSARIPDSRERSACRRPARASSSRSAATS